ncbi:hypothetical protein VNO80_21772 [Phaseolus coccineus]|uniref:Uncharacterized protein n=1 Tax=Phaseolus coccineus TaxID=3886 RepID=A0AAN9M2Z8_PHACN
MKCYHFPYNFGQLGILKGEFFGQLFPKANWLSIYAKLKSQIHFTASYLFGLMEQNSPEIHELTSGLSGVLKNLVQIDRVRS